MIREQASGTREAEGAERRTRRRIKDRRSTRAGLSLDGRLLVRIREAADMLAVSERQVWSLINTGELRAIRPAGIRVIRLAREDVAGLVARWREQSGGSPFPDHAADDVG